MAGALRATQHIRRMRGGAQSHLMRCEDGNFYIVKFQNNPQHVRVLANELLATRLAQQLGLPVAQPWVIEVDPWLVERTPELRIDLGSKAVPCASGLQFGTRFVVDPFQGQMVDYLPEDMTDRIANVEDFRGMLCLDKWTCNTNGRQAVFARKLRERKYRAWFIDQGYCFNAGEWEFIDATMRGSFPRNDVYAGVKDWDSFEPWLTRIEQMPPETIYEIGGEVPPEWCGEGGYDRLEPLLAELVERRAQVLEMVDNFRTSSRAPFPNWRMKRAARREM